ncbi:MAG TPA: hypothetical protein VFC79_07370 [Tissierellaceae bacterium]|nr:hypothetical protein [Tissierellaceae bacterium]
MVSLVRNGSRSVYITTKDVDSVIDFLKEDLDAEEMDIQVIQDRSREYQTVVLVSESSDSNEKPQVIKSILVPKEPINILSAIITSSIAAIVETIKPGANFVIMRSSGDLEKVVKAVQGDLGGEIISYDDYTKNDNSNNTIIGLTEKPLTRGIVASDFHDNFLLIKGEYGKIKRQIKMQALRYLNIGIGHKDWNEIEIRIYDMFGAYNLQYDRMMQVFDDLDIGLILGESWSKDYPKAMLSVQVYRVKFFTFRKPSELKQILVGLEYMEDGTRIVDYDVYFENDKLSWNKGLTRKERFKIDRKQLALEARHELFARLSKDTLKEVKRLEQEIFKTRYTG